MNPHLKNRVVSGVAWTVIEKLSTQAVGFVVSIILARLLTPQDYGTVALTTIFFAVANVLVDGGFGNALIQKKDADDLDFNSVFYCNIFLSAVVYLVLWIFAPSISDFYNLPELCLIIRVSAVSLVFNAVGAIQNAELTRKMRFNLSFRVSLVTCLASASVGVALALLDYGVWALVCSMLTTGFVGAIMRWLVIAWRPKCQFSITRLRPLFAYGWKMAVSGVIDQFFVQLNGLLIGKFYSRADLAFVNKGNSLPQLAMGEVDGAIGRVAFPTLVLLQGDLVALRNSMRRMIQSSTFLVFPLMVWIACCAHPIITILFGRQWTPATPYMMLACFSFALWPFHTINLRGIMAIGRSDIFLRLEIIKKLLKVIIIVSFFRYGVFAFMAASAFALGPMNVMVNAWPNRKLLGYTLGMQLRDVFPTALFCVAEALVILIVDFVVSTCFVGEGWNDNMIFLACKVFGQFLIGITVYFTLAFIFHAQPLGVYVRVVANRLRARCPEVQHFLLKWFA